MIDTAGLFHKYLCISIIIFIMIDTAGLPYNYLYIFIIIFHNELLTRQASHVHFSVFVLWFGLAGLCVSTGIKINY